MRGRGPRQEGDRRRRAAPPAALFVALALLLPGAATAQAAPAVSEAAALAAAGRDPTVISERRQRGPLRASAGLADGNWEVAYFAGGEEVALAVVDGTSGRVREAWTGYQVRWKMARGYPGAFGHRLNAPYVFIPLCALFLIGLFDWRRPLRAANLDLIALLAFGVSHFFFNRGEVGLSVPLVYPVLLYLLVRAVWIGLRGGEGLRSAWPAAWLLVAALFLIGVRAGLNIADSGAIDVGYASVVGADRILGGDPVYGNFPADVSAGDTYGPATYLAYVPAALAWPWSGRWDDLPAAHGAAVAFDLLAFLLLIALGLRSRAGPGGRRLAALLAFGWASYPYTAFALESNSNDALVAVALLALLLCLARPLARGALAAVAMLTKFAPALLVPMLATYAPAPTPAGAGPAADPGRLASPRRPALFAAGFAAAAVAMLLWPALDPGLATFFQRTVGYQAGRASPFSIWGQVPALAPLRIALLLATALAAIALARWPRRRGPVAVAALGAALLIAAQLTLRHWFYLYIVWFFPLFLFAAAATRRPRAPGPSPARSSPPDRRR